MARREQASTEDGQLWDSENDPRQEQLRQSQARGFITPDDILAIHLNPEDAVEAVDELITDADVPLVDNDVSLVDAGTEVVEDLDSEDSSEVPILELEGDVPTEAAAVPVLEIDTPSPESGPPSMIDFESMDDPVRMYLREIGRVTLLTAEDEKRLARHMEEAKFLETIEAGLRLDPRHPPTAIETTLCLFEMLRQAWGLVILLGTRAQLPGSLTPATLMNAIGFREVIDGKIDPNLISAVARHLGVTKEKAEAKLVELSLLVRVFPQELIPESRDVSAWPATDEMREMLLGSERQLSNRYTSVKVEAAEAQQRLTEANLRLVVSVAKKYIGRGMSLLDLIQEGNIGLIRAVEKFDYRLGFKFSTYATWWIRQAITRAISDQARTIRIPVHMVETINKLIRTSRRLLQELGREPTADEIAVELQVQPERVRDIIKVSQEPVSLDTPVGEEEDSLLGEFIADRSISTPSESAAQQLLKEHVAEVLGSLTNRERRVIQLRFGLEDGRNRTLEEVGQEFTVTRERIRQIEAKALRKLRHPSRSRKLKDYLE